MHVEYEGSIPKRCLYCGGLMIENMKHECITSGWSTNQVLTTGIGVVPRDLYEIDWEKVNSIDDIKAVLKVFLHVYSINDPEQWGIGHLVKKKG